jgi:hypothetical protein
VSYVYIIGPVRSDPQYKQKRQVLADISSGYQYQFFFPFERYKSFSLDAVRTDLRNAAVVIADLSLERPSCYFELGVAQALDLPVQMIAASGTPIHQTATPGAVIFYSDLDEYSLVIRRALALADSVPSPSPPDTPNKWLQRTLGSFTVDYR